MKKIFILISIMFVLKSAIAQPYVTIPDTNFVNYLQWLIPSAMNGNQLNTTHPDIYDVYSIDVPNRSISDLTGIEYFTALGDLDCSNNSLSNIPALASSLSYLNCSGNQLTSLPSLPSTLTYLDCRSNLLTSLPSLPSNLTFLDCHTNHLASIPVLPISLQNLVCSSNQLTNLPSLPNNIVEIICRGNQLSSLPTLPTSLSYLICDSNQLTSLPVLTNLLLYLDCNTNQLTNLSILNNNLQQLYCNSNLLTSLPSLPNSLIDLTCDYNQLTYLPTLPTQLSTLRCSNNQLTGLPELPHWLQYLNCSNNFISCFPTLPSFYWQELNLSGNPFTCLPNYTSQMDASLLAYPLCISGDTIHNPNNCSSLGGIIGFMFKDNNSNCIKDIGDLSLSNIKVSLFDSAYNQISQTYSYDNGVYVFPAITGTYTVRMDTAGMPYKMQCVNQNIDTTINLTTANPTAFNVNYAIACKPGFDVGVQSVVAEGLVFPGQTHTLWIDAGDMSQWNQLDCSAGVSGQVQITITGPVIYQGVIPGLLIPSIAGNVFTYSIADFGTINNSAAFGLIFMTDTTTIVDSSICVDVSVLPISGDNNSSNNSYNYCYNVSNSLDPNMKEVYPVKVLPNYNGYFTYTIHFQNIGTANAMNILILDTLNSNLDPATFQITNYSHVNTVSLNGHILSVRFPNILLPDSNSNQEASKGYLQFRIKALPNLSNGTQIPNSAWINFDYNESIKTNTAMSIFDVILISRSDNLSPSISIYPNPSPGLINIAFAGSTKDTRVDVLNSIGQVILSKEINNQTSTTLDLSNRAKGMYFIKVQNGDGITIKKVIVE